MRHHIPYVPSVGMQAKAAVLAGASLLGCAGLAAAQQGPSPASSSSSAAATPGTPGAPAAPKKVAVPAAVGPSSSGMLLSVIVPQLVSGKLSVEQAHQAGELSVGDALLILEKHVDPWGTIQGKTAVEARRGLAQLVMALAPEKVKEPAKLPVRVRLWLADYLGHLGDARVLALAQGILDEQKLPAEGDNPHTPGENTLVYQAIERIAWYHGDKKDFARAREAWLSMEKAHAKTGWWTAFANLQAARFSKLLGEKEKAGALYERSMSFGNALVTSAALNDQAQDLMKEGRWAEAQALLQRPVEGEGAPRARVMLWSQLGYALYRGGDLSKAREFSNKSAQAFAALSDEDKKYESLSVYASEAKQALEWADRLEKTPLVVLPAELRLPFTAAQVRALARKAPQGPGEASGAGPAPEANPALEAKPAPIVLRLSVRSRDAGRLVLTPSGAFVRAQAVPDGWTGQRKFFHEQEVRVEVDPLALAQVLAGEARAGTAQGAGGAGAASVPASGAAPGAAAARAEEDKAVATLTIRQRGGAGTEVKIPIRLAPEEQAPKAPKS